MERVFYILPPQGNDPQHLIVEVDEDQISFLFYRDDNEVSGIVKYLLPQMTGVHPMAEAIKKIRNSEADLQHSFRSVQVFYNFKTFTIIPKEFYEPTLKAEYLNLQFGKTGEVEIYEEKIKNKNLVAISRVPKEIDAAIKQNFPAAVFHLSSACQAKNMVEENIFDVIFFKKKFKVLIQRDSKFKMLQLFSYSNEADVLYHLLHTCSLLNIDPAKLTVSLSGMIEKDSSLYNTLRQYFDTINFKFPAEDIRFTAAAKDHSLHYFNHLISFISCVS